MKILKKTLISLLFLTIISSLYAEMKIFYFETSTIECIYDDLLSPGDPLFLKLIVDKPFMHNEIIVSVQIIENKTGKKIRSARMYDLGDEPKKIDSKRVFFVGLPLSTFLNPGNFTIEIYFNSTAFTKAMLIPITIEKKAFIEETIPLDPVNTAIKTDTSVQRMTQIDTLNAILNTINLDTTKTIVNFMLPVKSKRRTSFFGDRRIFAYSNGKSETSLHYGIDFGIPIGTEVYACANGKVVMSEMRNSTGWTIVIEHLPGLYSLYYHLDKMLVEKGDIVEQGNLIARSGNTGLATGPHLHWELRLLAEAVNPDYFVEKLKIFQ